MLHGAVVADAIVAPRVVLRLLSPRCAWCRGRCRWAALCRGRGRDAACGVMVAVVTPCGAVVAVAPCVVSRSQSLRRVLRLLSPHHAWCRGRCRRVALYHGRVRCHGRHCCAVWYCRRGHTTCDVAVTVVAPCGVKVVVAVVVPLVPQPRLSSWWHCRRGRCLHRGRPWRGRTAAHLSGKDGGESAVTGLQKKLAEKENRKRTSRGGKPAQEAR